MNPRKLLILFSFFFSIHCFSQTIIPAEREYNFINYSLDEGLRISQVNSMFQDSKGNIWVCGREGVAKFDGTTFTTYDISSGLPSGGAGSVAEDKYGNIWFGTWKGIAVLRNNKFYLDTSEGMPRKLSWGMFSDKDGTIWSANYNGLFHIDPSKKGSVLLKHYRISGNPDANEMRMVCRNKKGELIVGAHNGAYILQNDSLINYHGIGSPVYTMVELPDGREWFSGWGQPLHEAKDGKYNGSHNLGAMVLDMSKDKDGNVFLVTWDKGIFKYDGKTFTQFTLKNGLPVNSFWTVLCDKENNIWLGTWGEGISRFSGEKFTRFTERSGLLNNRLLAIAPDQKGNIWFASADGFTKFNSSEKTFQKFELPKESEELYSGITNMLVRSDKEVWGFGYASVGVIIKNNKIEKVPGLVGHFAMIDSKGKIWGSGEGAVFNMDEPGKRTHEYTSSTIGPVLYGSVYEDDEGNYWVTSGRCLARVSGDSLRIYGKKDGFLGKSAGCIIQYMPKRYLICSSGKIYNYYYNEDKFRLIDSITVQHGLLPGSILSMKLYKGSVYAAGVMGLNVFEMTSYKKGKKAIRTYSEDEGLSGKHCRIAFMDSAGGVWIYTNRGAYRFDPAAAKENSDLPITNITAIKLFLEEQDWSEYSDSLANGLPLNLTLPYDKNHLTFSFVGISHSAPSKVKYKFKLAGYDKAWSPPTRLNEATYSNISPGTYTFMVIACNKFGDWIETPANFVFAIKPPFWKTAWFYALCIIMTAVSFFLFVRYREKKLRREKQILEDKVTERTLELKNAYNEIEEKQKEIIDSTSMLKGSNQAYLLPKSTF